MTTQGRIPRALTSGMIGIALLILGTCRPAYATVILLNNWNVSQLQDTGDSVQVTITDTSLSFEFLYGTQPPTIQLSPTKGIDEISWNGWPTAADPLPTDWSLLSNLPHQMDGFGSFSVVYDFSGPDGNTGAGLGPITFTLPASGLSTDLAETHNFAVDVQFGSGCSGFVSDGTPNAGSQTSNAACGSPVPEPSTLLLLGSGLVAISMGVLWRRVPVRG